MKKGYYKLLALLAAQILFMPMPGSAQIPSPFAQSVSTRTKGDNVSELLKNATEDVSKRTLFSSQYHTKNGKFIGCYSKDMINYPDENGNLKPIKIELKSDAAGWVAGEQPYPCYFRLDRSTAIDLDNGQQVVFNKNCQINDVTYQQEITTLEEKNIKMNLTTDIHKNVSFIINGIESDYIFDKPAGDNVSVNEEIDFPKDYILRPDKSMGKDTKEGWSGDYVLTSADGMNEQARFHAPLCYDANGKWCVGTYRWELRDGKNLLITTIPSGWLKKATYPVTLDPKVTGPTTKWVNNKKSTNSCLWPHYSEDSILITIPGRITIYNLIIDYAYTTNQFTPVYMSYGEFEFATSCGVSRWFSCDTGTQRTTTGVCYLTPDQDFHDPLTCCYKPNCSQQQFWLSVYLSRTSFGTGCDTTYVWYNADIINPLYQYMAYIVGYTDSITLWDVTPTLCSNTCNATLNLNAAWGVPPYYISHPWSSKIDTFGNYTIGGCASSGNVAIPLTIPNCPKYCDSGSITIPLPIVIDQCLDTAKTVKQTKTLKPAPIIKAAPDTQCIFKGKPLDIKFTSCSGATIENWTGSDSSSGTGNISYSYKDTSNITETVTYKIIPSARGCYGDTITSVVYINPVPAITGLDTIMLGSSDYLTTTGGGTYNWRPATALSCTACANPVATPSVSMVYNCTITTPQGCIQDDSIYIIVLDEEIVIPNVFTPNYHKPNPTTGLFNDRFYIQGLSFYPNSKLEIYDRWGRPVLNTANYANNWDGGGQSDGVYFYVLTVKNGKKFKGFVQIIN